MEDDPIESFVEVGEGVSEEQFAHDTLERYCGSKPSDFQPYVILTNFPRYVQHFALLTNSTVLEGSMFKVAHDKERGISMLDFKIGSPAAALVIDLLAFLPIKSALLLGMCAGLRQRYKIGEWMVPLAAIRDEYTSNYYFPSEVPALANFLISRAITETLEASDQSYHLGITFTTNMRFWEYNSDFKERLKSSKAQCLDMECATLFIAAYKRKISLAALLIISDLPLSKRVKTKKLSSHVFETHMDTHIKMGIEVISCADDMLQHKVKGIYRRDLYRGKRDTPISRKCRSFEQEAE